MTFRIDATSGTAPYEQLRTQIAAGAADGRLPAGTKLPTVRALAEQLGVAANTVARAYRELEADGVVVTQGRRGTFVRSDALAGRLDAASRTPSWPAPGGPGSRWPRRPGSSSRPGPAEQQNGPPSPEGRRAVAGVTRQAPALVKPAASAASAVANHTSATVCSNHWPSGSWYFFESSLPLIGKPSGACDSSSSGACEPS